MPKRKPTPWIEVEPAALYCKRCEAVYPAPVPCTTAKWDEMVEEFRAAHRECKEEGDE